MDSLPARAGRDQRPEAGLAPWPTRDVRVGRSQAPAAIIRSITDWMRASPDFLSVPCSSSKKGLRARSEFAPRPSIYRIGGACHDRWTLARRGGQALPCTTNPPSACLLAMTTYRLCRSAHAHWPPCRLPASRASLPGVGCISLPVRTRGAVLLGSPRGGSLRVDDDVAQPSLASCVLHGGTEALRSGRCCVPQCHLCRGRWCATAKLRRHAISRCGTLPRWAQ